MNTRTRPALFSVDEAARYLSKNLNQEFLPVDVTILCKEQHLPFELNPEEYGIAKSDLQQFVTRTRIERFEIKKLTNSRKQFYFERQEIDWLEALYIVHGYEPPTSAIETVAFQFPDAYPKLWGAVDRGDIGRKHNSENVETWHETPVAWIKWFIDTNGLESGVPTNWKTMLIRTITIPPTQRTLSWLEQKNDYWVNVIRKEYEAVANEYKGSNKSHIAKLVFDRLVDDGHETPKPETIRKRARELGW